MDKTSSNRYMMPIQRMWSVPKGLSILEQNFNDVLVHVDHISRSYNDVLVPADHVSRSYNDTYYVDAETVLRCHTRAHQVRLLRKGYIHFLITGDVYRRDSIDATHYPVFHQEFASSLQMNGLAQMQHLMQPVI